MSHLPICGIVVYLTAAFLTPLLYKAHRRVAEGVFLASTLSNPVLQTLLILELSSNSWRPIVYTLGAAGPYEWTYPIRIVLEVDALSAFMALIVTSISAAVALFSIGYMEEDGLQKYYTLFLLLDAGMLGMVLTGDLFNLYVFLEITSISSYALVAFRKHQWEAVEAGMKYMIMGSLASTIILVSIALLYGEYGTLTMAQLGWQYRHHPTGMARVALAGLLAGFLMKGGIVPVHMWLADAHPAAPSTISALLSGLVIKVGIYSAARIAYSVFWMGTDVRLLGWLVVVVGAASIIVGNLLAGFQRDIKRLLAYSSIGQVGYVVTGLGIALIPGVNPEASRAAVDGALFHLLNHAVLKAMLFLSVGAIVHSLGTRDIGYMGGIAKRMPLTSAVVLLGAMGIIGAPPLNGFVSKWMLYEATAIFNPIIGAIAVLGTAFSTVAYGRLFYALLGRESRLVSDRSPRDPGPWMSVPMIFLAAASVLFGILPRIPIVGLVRPARAALLSPGSYTSWLKVAGGILSSPNLPPAGQPISVFGSWVPAVFLLVFAISIAFFLLIRHLSASGVRTVGEGVKVFLSGEDEREFEALQLPGTSVVWGFAEAVRSFVNALKREHSGDLTVYLFWLIFLYAVLILLWGGA